MLSHYNNAKAQLKTKTNEEISKATGGLGIPGFKMASLKMQTINEINDLVKLVSKLPGLGPKSAKRIVLKLINNRDELVKPMVNTLAQVYKNVVRCKSCGSLKSIQHGCVNCENIKEKFNKICVVEDIADQWSIENSNIYKGYFHILGGTISSVGQRKEELLINSLVERVKKR